MSNKAEATGMKEEKRELTPKLRFPEFREAAGWREASLGSVARFVNDRIRISEVPLNHYVSTENLLSDYAGVVSASKLPEIDSVIQYKPGDVLVSNIRPYLKKVWYSNRSGGASNDVLIVRARDSLRSDYLSFLLRNDAFIAFVMSGAKGVKMPRGDIATIKGYPLAYPSPAEQQKIADCLGTLDELIEAQSRKLDALKAHKKGLMQNLFPREGETTPRYRFPEFRDAQEWGVGDIDDIFKVTRGNVHSMKLVQDVRSDQHPYPVYSSQTKNNGLCGYYSDYLFEDAITWTTDGANAGDVNFRAGKFYCTNVCGVLLSDHGYANLCIASLINNVSKKHVSYVGNPKLMNGVMSRIRIPIPHIAEQQKIAECLTSADELIAAQTQTLEALKAHKKGLMQQLFPRETESEKLEIRSEK